LRLLRGARSRYVRSVSASQHSVNEYPYPACFQLVITDSSSGAYSLGCRPWRLENHAFHDASIASADHREIRGGLFVPSPETFPGPRDRETEPLTPLSQTLLDTSPRFLAARVCQPIRQGLPRPLPPRCREATWLFPVRDAFFSTRDASLLLRPLDRRFCILSRARRLSALLALRDPSCPQAASRGFAGPATWVHRPFVALGSPHHA
jgi:hypothetical protein